MMTPQLRERGISITVNNRPDVLARIAGTFSARGYNIESISANITRDPAVTRIIITTLCTLETITKIIKQLNRLVDVLDCRRIRRGQAVWREMVLARVPLTDEGQAALQKLLAARDGRIVSRDAQATVVEFTGEREAIQEILGDLEALGVEDTTRSGVIALERVRLSERPLT